VSGVTDMRFGNDDASWTPGSPTPRRGVDAPSGGGEKTVFAQFRDAAGTSRRAPPTRSGSTVLRRRSPSCGRLQRRRGRGGCRRCDQGPLPRLRGERGALLAACDANGDGSIAGVTDAIFLLTFAYLGGEALRRRSRLRGTPAGGHPGLRREALAAREPPGALPGGPRPPPSRAGNAEGGAGPRKIRRCRGGGRTWVLTFTPAGAGRGLTRRTGSSG